MYHIRTISTLFGPYKYAVFIPMNYLLVLVLVLVFLLLLTTPFIEITCWC